MRYFRRKQIETRRKASSGFSLPQLCLTQLGLRQSYKHPRSNLAPHRTGHQARLSSRIKETGEEECFIYKINWWCLFSDEPSRSRKGLIRVQNQKPWYCSWPCLSLCGSSSPSCQLCRVPGSLNNGHGLDAACVQEWSRFGISPQHQIPDHLELTLLTIMAVMAVSGGLASIRKDFIILTNLSSVCVDRGK